MTAEWVRLARRDIGTARAVLATGDPENALYLGRGSLWHGLMACRQAAGESTLAPAASLLCLARTVGLTHAQMDSDVVGVIDRRGRAAQYGATADPAYQRPTTAEVETLIAKAEMLLNRMARSLGAD